MSCSSNEPCTKTPDALGIPLLSTPPVVAIMSCLKMRRLQLASQVRHAAADAPSIYSHPTRHAPHRGGCHPPTTTSWECPEAV